MNRWSLWGIWWLIALCGMPAAAVGERPNIVVILSDDYGYGSANCYGADRSLIRTPNIDRLAREGRRFTDANTASSVCSPTRYALLTGRYCWRTSLKHEVLGTTSPLHIEPDRLTLASLLKRRGYRTAAIGKWHLGYGNTAPVDFTQELKPGPLEIGFDYHFGVPANHGDISGVYVENRQVAGLRSSRIDPSAVGKNFKGRPFLGLDAPHRVDPEVMPHLTRKVVAWLEQQTSDRPFFLYYTPVAVHNPVTPSAATRGSSAAGPYGDWIHELDVSVGQVLDALDRKDLTRNTLVLFTSDNGGVNKPTVPGPATDALKAGLKISGRLRGGKHDVWQGGFQVPYIVRWPGHVPAGTVSHQMLSLVDTLATVAAVMGESLPDSDRGAEDSINMLPAWLGTAGTEPLRKELIVHSADGNFAIRQGRWKWIEGVYHPATRTGALRLRADQFQAQLYDLQSDPSERHNVLQEHPELAEQLHNLLNRLRAGGYSRTMPPPYTPPPPPEPLRPTAGPIVLETPLDQWPSPPWSEVRGRWVMSHGSLRGSQQRGEKIGAAIRAPLRLKDFDCTYELLLPFVARHTVRLQCASRPNVFQVQVSAARLAIVRQRSESEGRGGEVLDEQRLQLGDKQWATLHLQCMGDELAVQVGDVIARAKHVALQETKTVLALMVQGSQVGLRGVKIYKRPVTSDRDVSGR